MNSFFGIGVGARALSASQAAINTINHNISNAKTPGYSRQVVSQKASDAIKTGDGSGMVGTGVDIDSIIRVRNMFLDNRYWNQNIAYGEWSVKNDSLSAMEAIMNSSSDNGLSDTLNKFVSSLEDLAKDPSGNSARKAVMAQGSAFCKYLNNMAGNLQDLLRDCNNSIKTNVDEINSYAKQISALNKQIYKAEMDGSSANDLRDQRTLLVDKLSSITDIQVSEVSAGKLPNGKDDLRFSVKINGIDLVNHYDAKALACYKVNDSSERDGTYAVRWAGTSNEVTFNGGEIKGYIDLCTGTGVNGAFKGIPYYKNQLDTFARTFAKAFNEGIYSDGVSHRCGHAGGVGSDGSTGIRFFSYDGKSSGELMESGSDMDSIYENISAANISLSSDIENDTEKIAAASASGEAENSDNLRDLLEFFDDADVFANGTPEDNINSISVTMGVETSYASNMADSNKNILDHINTNRASVSGVSIDEETTNLIIYQQAYNAAAKVISVLDEVLNVTINSLGADW
jgi:flagellar hook-associated protein 1 FlgK